MQETDLVFDGVTVRMYEPVERSDILPGIVYFHGGGFVFGNLGEDNLRCFHDCHCTYSVTVRIVDMLTFT